MNKRIVELINSKTMKKEFIKDCLFFQSKDEVSWLIGVFVWITIFVNIIEIFKTLQKFNILK